MKKLKLRVAKFMMLGIWVTLYSAFYVVSCICNRQYKHKYPLKGIHLCIYSKLLEVASYSKCSSNRCGWWEKWEKCKGWVFLNRGMSGVEQWSGTFWCQLVLEPVLAVVLTYTGILQQVTWSICACFFFLIWIVGILKESPKRILKEISPKYSLEGLILKLKLQYFGHLMRRTDSLGKTLMMGKTEGRRRRGWQRMRWMDGITDSMDLSFSKFQQGPGVGEG